MSHIVAAIVLSFATLAGAPAPRLAPSFDAETAVPSVTVAISKPGESYAVPDECMQKDVICMRYPLWFQVEPIYAVYGSAPQKRVEVTTYTHYGQPDADAIESPRILLLLEQHGRFMMPAYASERVWRRSDGQHYILLDSPSPLHWVPCSTADLRERIDARQFSARAHLALDDYSVKEHPDMFVRHKTYASPRYGISITRLSAHLKELEPATAAFRCVHDDES